MNSFDLIALHRDRYPATHITEETLDTVLYQLIRLTSKLVDPSRSVLIRGTCYEMISRSYSGQDAVDLRLLAQKRFEEIYEQSCLCLFLCLV